MVNRGGLAAWGGRRCSTTATNCRCEIAAARGHPTGTPNPKSRTGAPRSGCARLGRPFGDFATTRGSGGVRHARRWPSLAALAGPSRPHGPYGRPEAPWASNNRASGAGHAVAAPRCPRGRNARAGRSSQSGFGPRRRADGTRGRPAMLGRGFAPRAARGARWRRAGVLLADA